VLDLLEPQRPGTVLLDVKLNGGAGRACRFILATGYGSQNRVPGSSGVIDKPYNRQMQVALAGFETGEDESLSSSTTVRPRLPLTAAPITMDP
jgi:hypothetical protein